MTARAGSGSARAKSAPAPLSAYRKKRDAARTPEPMGAPVRAPKGQPAPTRFVIQEHHARSLHWDFRLERDGVFVSWALPKGLPMDPHANHLAVHVEDHPLEYGSFEGDIPKGQYGAGHVSIWDQGTYETVKWRDDEVKVDLHGQRVSGRYVLFPTTGNDWIIHRMSPAPEDVEPMPRNVKPMLALAGELPTGRGWSFEFKWDGVRAIVYVEDGRVHALTRNDKSLDATFPELKELARYLGSRSAVLDGEIVALNKEQRPDFASLTKRLHVTSTSTISALRRSTPASFFAFDLLYLDGRSLLDQPYDERRRLLASLHLDGESVATPPSVTTRSGPEVLQIARERGLEGVVAKRRKSPYSPGARNGDWVKVKNLQTQEVVIGGWTEGRGEREGSLGALLLGLPDGRQLTYVGKVGTGFNAEIRADLLRRLRPLARKTSPFSTPLGRAESALAHFVRPSLVGEVRFAEWTKDGALRQPSWRGLRVDKAAKDVVRES